VIAQFGGLPDDTDALTPEWRIFAMLFVWGMIPVAVVGVGAAVSAARVLRSFEARLPRVLALVTVVLLVAGIPFAWHAFRTWAGSGW